MPVCYGEVRRVSWELIERMGPKQRLGHNRRALRDRDIAAVDQANGLSAPPRDFSQIGEIGEIQPVPASATDAMKGPPPDQRRMAREYRVRGGLWKQAI